MHIQNATEVQIVPNNSVNPCAVKFNMVSNEHGHKQKCHFFCFRQGIPFWKKFGPKNKNCKFKSKFGTYSNSKICKAEC